MQKRTEILVSVGLACWFCTITASADDALTTLLDRIDSLLGEQTVTDETGLYRYRLSYDVDFPCTVTIKENSVAGIIQWTRTYRFELHDLQPGQLLASRDQRRAITYSSEKLSDPATQSHRFAPKKIAAIGLKVPADREFIGKLQQAVDAAIAMCSERNLF